jgi:hypothetical protein
MRPPHETGYHAGRLSRAGPAIPPEQRPFRFGVAIPAELEISTAIWETDRTFHTRSGPRPPRARTISEEEMPHSPHDLVGETDEMVETLLARREHLGISYITLDANELAAFEPIMRRLAG